MPFGEDGDLHITYNPYAFTVTLEDALKEEEHATRSIITGVMAMITKWDLLDEKGQTIKLTRKELEKVPTMLLSEIMNAINKDVSVGEAKGAT